jgi:type IV pilus assembly protein PilA
MRKNGGFSLLELLIVVAIILIVAAIAIPNFMRARIAANEASAASSLRVIANAQVTFKILNPNGYAADLTALGPAGAALVTPELGTAPFSHNGYNFSTTGDKDAFQASATPAKPGMSGVRTFCTDTPSVIYHDQNGAVCTPGTSTVL